MIILIKHLIENETNTKSSNNSNYNNNNKNDHDDNKQPTREMKQPTKLKHFDKQNNFLKLKSIYTGIRSVTFDFSQAQTSIEQYFLQDILHILILILILKTRDQPQIQIV